jgi:D-galactarolactone cycloisomerase
LRFAQTFAQSAARKAFKQAPYELDKDGCVYPLDTPGIGLDVDEAFIAANPVIEGPGFV